MKKRILILTVILLLLFVMSSCFEDDDKTDGNLSDQLPECEHQSGDWIIDSEPDCVTPGTKHAECIKCGEIVESEIIIAKGHSFKDGECTVCGKSYSKNLVFVSLGDKTCYVSGIGECTDKEIVIPPESPEGDKVVAIGDSAFQNSNITSVEIAENIVKISNCAFDGCQSLRSVLIGDKVEEIGDYAFRDCLELVSVSLGKKLHSIGFEAFNNCDALESVELPVSLTIIGGRAFDDCGSLKRVIIPESDSPLQIKDNAFSNCTALLEILIPDNAISLGICAFDGCIKLENVYIGDGIRIIPEYAFRDCFDLTSPTIGKKVESIGFEAFVDCVDITCVLLPASLKKIEPHAFKGCIGLEDVLFSDDIVLESIGDNAFSGCIKLKGIELPESLTKLGNCVFDNCNSLEYAIIGNNVKEIPEYAFRDCFALTSVSFGSGIKKIGYEAFSSCRSLEKVHLNDGVTEIVSNAFSGCSSLNQLVLVDTIEKIDNSAFWACGNLRRVFYEGNQSQWESIDLDGSTHFAFDTPFYHSQDKYISGNAYYYNKDGEPRIWYVSEDSFYTEEYRLDFLDKCGNNILGQELLAVIEDEYKTEIAGWETLKVTSDPAYVFDPNNGMISKKDIYKAVLFDLMIGENNDMGLFEILEGTSVGFAKDIAKRMLKQNGDEGFTLDGFKELLTIKSCDDVKAELKHMVSKEYIAVFDVITANVANAYEAAMAFSRYYALQQVKQGYIDILVNLCESGAFSWDMKKAAEELIEAYEDAFDQTLLQFQTEVFVDASLKDIDKYLREKTIETIAKLDPTGVVAFYLVPIKVTGKILVSILEHCNMDKVAEAYYKLDGLVTIERILSHYINSIPDCDYLKLENRDKASVFMDAVELYKKAVLMENRYAKNFFTELYNAPGDKFSEDDYKDLLGRIDGNTELKASLYKQFNDSVKGRYIRYYN